MSRMKTLILYALAVVAAYLLTQLLINVSIESTYKTIQRKDEIKQVVITQAEATIANGRIKGIIVNSEENPINGKYVRIDFYSERDVLMGTKYIDISTLGMNQVQNIEMYFKLENVSYYEVSIADEKTEPEIELLPNDLTKSEVILATFMVLLIL